MFFSFTYVPGCFVISHMTCQNEQEMNKSTADHPDNPPSLTYRPSQLPGNMVVPHHRIVPPHSAVVVAG
jgi:hypothetical protein